MRELQAREQNSGPQSTPPESMSPELKRALEELQSITDKKDLVDALRETKKIVNKVV